MSIHAHAQVAMIPTVNSMTNASLWTALTTIDVSSNTMFGKCRVLIATSCANCFCDYYFRANIAGSYGMYGWPKNPSSGDSTGCLGNGCWGGYTSAMCTSDNKANARAMLLDALNKNACGNPVPPIVTGGVGLRESSQFFFVNPDQNGGLIECGTTKLGGQVGTDLQFTVLPKSICESAYHLALVNAANKNGNAKYITKAQLLQNSLTTGDIQNASAVAGQLMESYSLFNLAGLQGFLDYSDTQYNAMSFADVALFYVAAGENSNILPAAVKARVIISKFDTARVAGDIYIVTSEIEAARIILTGMLGGVVNGQKFGSLSEAVKYLKENPQSNQQKSKSNY
jgi:hypothetical protein